MWIFKGPGGEVIDEIITGSAQEPVGHGDREYGVIGERAAGAEQVEVFGFVIVELVYGANNIADD